MKFDIFSPKAPPIIGVDISDATVKMVELVQDKKGIRLERFAIHSFSESVIVDGAVVEMPALVEALTACYKKLGSKIKGVATCLPSSMIVTKTFKMSSGMSDSQVEEQVFSEMANNISFSIDEASLDFQVAKPPVDAEPDAEINVFASAALRARVDERVEAIEGAELKAVIMDSELLSLIDVAQRFMVRLGINQVDANVMIVDVGVHATHFTFLRSGEVVYSREHAFGGHQITHEIEQKFSVNTDEARKIQTGLKSSPDQEQLERMRKDFSEAAGQEIKRAVQLFTTSTDFTSVDRVLLCGAGVTVPGIEAVVGESLGIATDRLRPFDGMSVAPGLDMQWLQQECVSLVVASGLALRRFDK